MDDFRTLRQLIVGWLLLLVALIPMNAQNGNVLGPVSYTHLTLPTNSRV